MDFDHLTYHFGKTISNSEKILDKTLKREITLARNIQTQLLNGKTPTFEGGEVSGITIPARLIGGDYYDFYPLMDGKIRMIIGDVMGKGIPAAMLMILTRGAFRSASESTKSPGETLTAINQAIYEDLRTLKSFVTLFCADWDPRTSILTYANAGHHIPLFIREGSHSIVQLPKVKGVMVGGLPNQEYKDESVHLEEKDTIFFYTDGIVEAQNHAGNRFKLDRLIQTLWKNKDLSVGEIEKSVMTSVSQFTEGVPQKDDITMVLLKIRNQMADVTNLNSPLES